MDVPYKNFCLACVPGARSAQGREDGGVFLWLLSLHKQRSALQQPKADQVTRPPKGAESLALALEFFACLQANKSTAFTPYGRELLFFACAKKSNQKKAHPVLAPSAPRRSRSASPAEIFVRDIHVPYKNVAHPCAPPYGLYLPALPLRYGAPRARSTSNNKSNSNSNSNGDGKAKQNKTKQKLLGLRTIWKMPSTGSSPLAAPCSHMPQRRNDLVEQHDQAAPHQITLSVSYSPSARRRKYHAATWDMQMRNRINSNQAPAHNHHRCEATAKIQTTLPFVTSNGHRPRRIVLSNRPHPRRHR
ncbi:hypothetical protein [Xanthomonas campestris]|uniref:hypothetical protein n=1 Tax=Xanthomonas campestris TaxID=339 RepID=UPI001374C41A|nr:hypothetical protein [Xanthomonas campestris]